MKHTLRRGRHPSIPSPMTKDSRTTTCMAYLCLRSTAVHANKNSLGKEQAGDENRRVLPLIGIPLPETQEDRLEKKRPPPRPAQPPRAHRKPAPDKPHQEANRPQTIPARFTPKKVNTSLLRRMHRGRSGEKRAIRMGENGARDSRVRRPEIRNGGGVSGRGE